MSYQSLMILGGVLFVVGSILTIINFKNAVSKLHIDTLTEAEKSFTSIVVRHAVAGLIGAIGVATFIIGLILFFIKVAKS